VWLTPDLRDPQPEGERVSGGTRFRSAFADPILLYWYYAEC